MKGLWMWMVAVVALPLLGAGELAPCVVGMLVSLFGCRGSMTDERRIWQCSNAHEKALTCEGESELVTTKRIAWLARGMVKPADRRELEPKWSEDGVPYWTLQGTTFLEVYERIMYFFVSAYGGEYASEQDLLPLPIPDSFVISASTYTQKDYMRRRRIQFMRWEEFKECGTCHRRPPEPEDSCLRPISVRSCYWKKADDTLRLISQVEVGDVSECCSIGREECLDERCQVDRERSKCELEAESQYCNCAADFLASESIPHARYFPTMYKCNRKRSESLRRCHKNKLQWDWQGETGTCALSPKPSGLCEYFNGSLPVPLFFHHYSQLCTQ